MPPQAQYGSTQDCDCCVHDDEEALLKHCPESDTENSESDEGNTETANNPDGPTNEYVLNVAFLSFVGFMGLQAVFALIAHSESMLADSEAMSVDALTYLFNMCAERIKNRPPTQAELQLPLAVREHRIEMKRLYLELIPPMISVTTLIIVTIGVVKEAFTSLFGGGEAEEEDVSAGLMLSFSGLNLVLDVVNVMCFARANQAYGFQPINSVQTTTYDDFDDQLPPSCTNSTEKAQLLANQENETRTLQLNSGSNHMPVTVTRQRLFERLFGKVNLNMCSAWTHIIADTMRSLAVLIAAGIACTFDAVSPATADSCAAIVVSITILISLIPLIRGIVITAKQFVIEFNNTPSFNVKV